jgi:hypothetical protein
VSAPAFAWAWHYCARFGRSDLHDARIQKCHAAIQGVRQQQWGSPTPAQQPHTLPLGWMCTINAATMLMQQKSEEQSTVSRCKRACGTYGVEARLH